MERVVPCLLRLSLHVIERNSNEKPPRVYASLRFSGGNPSSSWKLLQGNHFTKA